MRLCDCTVPLRSALAPDRLRCLRCGHWTPHGRILSPAKFELHANEAKSLLTKLVEDWPYVFDLAHQPTHRAGIGHNSGPSDPTGAQVANPKRAAIHDHATITSRLLERALWALRSADEAVGDALLAAEPPGPPEHVQAPYHDPHSLFPGRPDLAQAHAAKQRRHDRGEL